MPKDPKECRQRALHCVLMAKGARSPEGQHHFYLLAQSWIKLAQDLEQVQIVLDMDKREEKDFGRTSQ